MIAGRSPEQDWQLQKAKLRLLFSNLSEEDLSFDYGKKEVMMTSLQAKLGKSRDELNILLADLTKHNNSTKS